MTTLLAHAGTMIFSTKITRLSSTMCEFLNISDPEKYLSRSEIMKLFYYKCKEKGIYPTKHKFHSEELRTLLAVPTGEELTILNLNKYLILHMIDVEPPQPRNDEDD